MQRQLQSLTDSSKHLKDKLNATSTVDPRANWANWKGSDVHCSTCTSPWSPLCPDWKATGCCNKALSCDKRHPGFPVRDETGELVDRCIYCGKNGQMGEKCTNPGGGADPKRQEVWRQYNLRKFEAQKNNYYNDLRGGRAPHKPPFHVGRPANNCFLHFSPTRKKGL